MSRYLSFGATHDELKPRLPALVKAHGPCRIVERENDFAIVAVKPTVEQEFDALPPIVKPVATKPAKKEEKPIEIVALPADLMSIAFPPRRYSWGRYKPRRATTALIAEGAVGKSTLSLMAQVYGAAGTPLFELPTTEGLYFYFSAEDDLTEVHRRVQKIMATLSTEEQRKVFENFRIINAVGKGLYFLAGEKNAIGVSTTRNRIIDAVRAMASGRQIVHVAIDTVSRILGPGEENSNPHMALIESAGAAIAQALDCAVSLLHHTAKAAAREGIADAHTGRGASSFGDNCRSVLRLMPATADMVKALDGIDRADLERGDILKLVHAKLSYDRKSDPIWLRRTADGLLERITPTAKNVAAVAEQMLQQFAAWWDRNERKHFTRTTVTKAKSSLRQIWPTGVSEAAADAFFAAQYAAHTFLRTHEKIKGGGDAYTMNPVTAEALLVKAASATLAAEREFMGVATPEETFDD